MFQLSYIDLAIIALYFVMIIFIGLWLSRRTKTGDDLFLAGRSLSWGIVGISLFASNMSSTTLIGLSGQAYLTGLSVSNYEWMAAVVLVFMAIFFIPFYINTRITTVPEFLEKRFDFRSRKYFSALTLFLNITVDTAGSLYAGAIVINLFFPDIAIWQTCLVLAFFAGLYTAAGGLRAVVYTDVIQAVILIFGSVFMAVMVFQEFDFSWPAITSTLPDGHLSLIRPMDDPTLPWLGTLIGVPILGFYFWCTNQFIVQRVLGARSLNDARWGALLGGLLKLPVLFVMVLPGAAALLLYPELETPDLVFPTLIVDLLPAGIVGLVLAGLIAAIMSSIDSTLNSSSTLVVIDFVKPLKPGLTPADIAYYGKITTLIFMVIAAFWAPMIQFFPGLFAYLQQALSYAVPPVVTIFILGLFWPKGSPAAAIITLVGGHIISAATFALNQFGYIELHFTIVAGILTFICCVIFWAASLLTSPPKPEQVREATWNTKKAGPVNPKLPWYKDYRIQSGILLLLTFILVVSFW